MQVVLLIGNHRVCIHGQAPYFAGLKTKQNKKQNKTKQKNKKTKQNKTKQNNNKKKHVIPHIPICSLYRGIL